MDSIRIENLRCFKDTGEIKLLPLNIAVGKNSCGKSTILRVFPLFKQTLEAKVSEPILWYGRYVDFGDFKQSINKNYLNEEIGFQFKFKIDVKSRRETQVLLNLKIRNGDFSKVSINLSDNDDIYINYGKDGVLEGVSINNIEIGSKTDKHGYVERYLIPTLYNEMDGTKYNNYMPFSYNSYFYNRKDIENRDELLIKIMKIIQNAEVKKENYIEISEKIRDWFVEALPLISELDIGVKDIIRGVNNRVDLNDFAIDYNLSSNQYNDIYDYEDSETEKQVLKIVKELKRNYREIYTWSLSKNINFIINKCNEYLYTYFTNITYIAPLRATAERYYRIQGLAVDDIDSRGENVPMILKNMEKKEKEAFESWMQNKFDISITTDLSDGHISLFINRDNNKVNMADTGFGYSQILPIILLLWKVSQNKNSFYSNKNIFEAFNKKDIKKLIVIEQPELHLHPKMQAQLMDVILEILKGTNKINFLIETHSQTIIDHIGGQIEKNKIKQKSVNVLLVDQKENYSSDIRSVSYTKEGYLKDWPIDFFTGDEW